jgi:hypothetical protein
VFAKRGRSAAGGVLFPENFWTGQISQEWTKVNILRVLS